MIAKHGIPEEFRTLCRAVMPEPFPRLRRCGHVEDQCSEAGVWFLLRWRSALALKGMASSPR